MGQFTLKMLLLNQAIEWSLKILVPLTYWVSLYTVDPPLTSIGLVITSPNWLTFRGARTNIMSIFK